RDRELDLVRRAEASVTLLEANRHRRRVGDAVPAPGLTDARLHRAERLPVRMPRLEPGVDQPSPDARELFDAGAEQVDALPAGDLRVQPEVPRDLADHDQLLGADLAAGNPRDHRVAAVALHVGEEVVVGVLQRSLLAVEDVTPTERSEDRRDCRLADLT